MKKIKREKTGERRGGEMRKIIFGAFFAFLFLNFSAVGRADNTLHFTASSDGNNNYDVLGTIAYPGGTPQTVVSSPNYPVSYPNQEDVLVDVNNLTIPEANRVIAVSAFDALNNSNAIEILPGNSPSYFIDLSPDYAISETFNPGLAGNFSYPSGKNIAYSNYSGYIVFGDYTNPTGNFGDSIYLNGDVASIIQDVGDGWIYYETYYGINRINYTGNTIESLVQYTGFEQGFKNFTVNPFTQTINATELGYYTYNINGDPIQTVYAYSFPIGPTLYSSDFTPFASYIFTGPVGPYDFYNYIDISSTQATRVNANGSYFFAINSNEQQNFGEYSQDLYETFIVYANGNSSMSAFPVYGVQSSYGITIEGIGLGEYSSSSAVPEIPGGFMGIFGVLLGGLVLMLRSKLSC